ncbi:MAG TPA: hypothetical protein DCY20_11010 [Firmicutes bacterium]|nr:hypothetical protein [Bacillota bacterium]
MAKRVEKGPVLFVDTSFKGCEIEEQTIYKTPKPQQKDIVSSSFVHTFDSNKKDDVVLEEMNQVENQFSKENASDFSFDLSAYETVNIIVDEVGGPREEEVENVYEETQYINFFSTDTWEPVDLEQHVLAMDQVEVQVVVEDEVQEEVIDSFIDEDKLETISFIRELVERPLMMKAPVVQVVTSAGQQITGKITSMSENSILLEDFMDNETELTFAHIEGIRILQL